MNFFTTSEGEKIADVKNFDASEGFGGPIAHNTEALACVDAVQWKTYEGVRSISITWQIVQPKELASRKVFHSIKVFDPAHNKADKAKRMLAALDSMHGGKLMAAGVEPTDELLNQALANKLSLIKIGYWEIKESGKSGNYVQAVSERQPGNIVANVGAVAKTAEKKAAAPKASPDYSDDDIPF